MKKLLVVVDMQNDFIDGVLGSQQAKDIVDKVVEKIQEWDGPVIATMDTHYEDTYNDTVESKSIPIHCIFGTGGWHFNKDIQKALLEHENSDTLMKIDRFGSPSLPQIVVNRSIDYVEFVGVCTDICVISNALMLRSINPRMDISVDSSCCAGINEASHNAALSIMKECCVDIL